MRRDQLMNSKLKDGSFIFFRAKDDKGRMAILRLTSAQSTVGMTSMEKARVRSQRKLALTFAETSAFSNLMQQRKKKFNRSRR